MAPSSEKAQIINKWQKVDHQKKMKKTKTKKKNKKRQEIPVDVLRTPSKTHLHKLAGKIDSHNMKKGGGGEENKEENIDTCASSGGCSTPKAERFKIPEILSCPPAPKKKRVFQNYSSIIRSPIAFFSSPDIDLFFSSVRNVSA